MNQHIRIALFITVLGTILVGAWRYIEPMINEQVQTDVSDASGKKGNIIIGMDGWVGYFPLCSGEMRKRLYRSGYGLKCIDDSADYQQRFKKLKQGDYQFAVATVDSYILNGEDYDYPGPIISVIDESKGGDAIVAWSDKITSLDDLKALKNFVIAYTPASPSHHLLKAVSSHFDIQSLKSDLQGIETEGSKAALDVLLDKKADVAVLWEPEVSKALNTKAIVRLLGTEDTRQLIVDILIASQSVVKNDPELVKLLLKTYFRTIKYYRENHQQLISDIMDHFDINKQQTLTLLKGVEWVNLTLNAEKWYGLTQSTYSEEALITAIDSAIDILLEHGDFKQNPLPDEDPYRLTNSRFIQELYNTFSKAGGFTVKGAQQTDLKKRFSALTKQQWDLMVPVGSLKTRHIVFSSGTSNLAFEGKKQIDDVIKDLQHYPNFRIEIRGHSGLRGNKDANLALSQSRADEVKHYIQTTNDIEKNRVRAIGFGSLKPLKKRPGESSRRYHGRLPRVEVALVKETF